MKSHKARIICFQLTISISFIFLTQAVSARGEVTHLIDVVDTVDGLINKTNIAIIRPEGFTPDLKVIKDELFALKGISELPAHTKVFFYNVDQGTLYNPEVIDERDRIYFVFMETVESVSGSEAQPPRYEATVSIESATSLPKEIVRVLGEVHKNFGLGSKGRESVPKKCTYVTLMPLGESLEGRGNYYAIFELFALKRSKSDKEDKKEPLRKFTFPIHEIYHFRWTLGYIHSTLNNPEYGVIDIFNPTTSQKEKVLAITSKGDTQFDPVLSLVIYRNGSDPRLDPDRKELKDRFHLVVGSPVLSGQFFRNFFAGINYEFSRGVNIIAGVRVGKVKKLNSDIVPYEPGKGGTPLPEDVTLDDISFKERWESSFSLGITFDTAVVTKFFTRLF